MDKFKYKFTIISAVYNVEPFIKDAVESVINQDIGINNIQLILVDDGSPDNSGKICDEYAAKYPNNITVIHKENGGASSARNMGIELAEGKYVNFFDSDDMLAPNVLSTVWNFFEQYYNETDIVAIPLTFFDAKEGEHMLNYKFDDGSRVVDLKKQWKFPHLHISSSFVKNEVIKGVRFDTNLSYAEDGKVAQTVILERQTLGLVNEARYLYRKRSSGEASAIQSSGHKPNWYIPVVENFHLALIKMALDKLGYVPKYLQNTVMYELQWRLKQADINGLEILSADDKRNYLKLIKKVLEYIDNDVILAQRHILREHKFLALCLKYGSPPELKATDSNILAVFDDKTFFSLSASRVGIERLMVEKNSFKISGYVNRLNMPFENYTIMAFVNGIAFEPKISNSKATSVLLNNDVVIRQSFEFEIPMEKGCEANKVNIGANINGKKIIFSNVNVADTLPLNGADKDGFVYMGKWKISFKDGTFYLSYKKIMRKIKKVLKYLTKLFKKLS